MIRNLTGIPTPTPQVPTAIVGFGDVNAIEEILVTGEETIHNTQLGFRYCGEIYSNGSY